MKQTCLNENGFDNNCPFDFNGELLIQFKYNSAQKDPVATSKSHGFHRGLFDVDSFAYDNKNKIVNGMALGKSQDDIIADILSSYSL